MTEKLPLPDETVTTLYRLIVNQVKRDPAVKAVVRTFKDWSDSAADRTPIDGPGVMPALEFYPSGGPEQFYTPDAVVVPLVVTVNLWVGGLNVDNCLNLWAAVLRSFRPHDQLAANAFRNSLVAAGAETGLVLATRPAYPQVVDASDSAYFAATGELMLRFVNK